MTDVCVKTINELFAYILKNGGIPIQKPEQMLPDKHLVYKPLDEEWQKSINESKRWATGYTGNNPNNQALQADYRIRDKLLSFGGFEACVEYQDPDAEAILYRGQFWYGDKVDFMKGKPSDCHRNSCELWEINRSNIKIAIVTGYA
ncbi:MAG: hypothetical protein FWD97_09370, partial [Defluviitaleaceae bacterium]|nr:hypothetical protein [Defluviitaleaceae bacterium]